MKSFLLLTLAGAAIALSLTSLTHAQDRPNIVLFLVDDMGWMDSEPYGSEYYDTPNMSRLAKLSMRFTDAYAMPLCSPTRATLLSGQYPSRHLVTTASGHQPPQEPGASLYPAKVAPTQPLIYAKSKNYLDPDIVTLAEILRDAGYRTGHFGKWHLGATQPHWPDQNGFDTTWFCTPDPGPPSYFSPYGVVPEGEPDGRNKVGNITDGPEGEYITDRLTDEAIGFIKGHAGKSGEPFFLNLWQYGVHGPWGHKEEYTREFAKKTDPRGEQRNPIMASMLKSVDDSLGRILDTLDEQGLTENTLFVFFSDNGGNIHSNGKDDRKIANVGPGHPKYAAIEDWKKWAGDEYPTNNAPLREGKGRIYEGGQRVPLMVRWPGRIEEGSLSSEIVHAVDLYPTILEAAKVGLPEKQSLDGLSLLPVLTEGAAIDREAIFTWFPFPQGGATVRSGKFKLVKRFETTAARPNLVELFDLEADIGETNNLAGENPEIVARLTALLEAHLEETGALQPKPNPNYNAAAASAQTKAARAPDFGLVPKQCETQVAEGILKVTPAGKNPFLGTAQVKMPGPITLRMKVRSEAGGAGRIAWRKASQESFPEEQVVDYTVTGGSKWQDVTVTIPAKGVTSTIRIHVPGGAATEFQAIEFSGANGATKTWDFEK
ncbi:MAG: sulfatase [Verrucomicrobiales bacterium]|nr:sulfatase [Verrucomicrobiales bacterium]